MPTLDPPPFWVAWNHRGAGSWPRPEENAGLDLNAAGGAGWLDDVARRARDRLRADAAEDAVIGHADGLAGNLRWAGDRLLVVHDWDSVTADREDIPAGVAAAQYPSVRPDRPATVEDTERFLVAYVRARGRELRADPVQRAWAAGVWTRAYDTRYQHAAGQPVTALSEPGARERLRRAGAGL